MQKTSLLILLLCCSAYLFGQSPGTSCGQKTATENLFRNNPQLKSLHDQIEERLYQYNRTKDLQRNDLKTEAVVYLPVVVHIIHNNGPENISNAQVQTAIQHLNEAFANTGYYDPADGANTQIQFCLAKRDPSGNATGGINRVVSSLTVMNGWEDYSVDMAVKDLSRWDPRCYINIWVVKDITGGVAGYAYLPGAHGTSVDGIVLEAGYFGSSYSNDVVVIHEIGHYLGLYHTFDGGCKNDDCSKDGDRVCDTPPDQSTVWVSCGGSANSCTTDTQSGFSSDQNDLLKDYMDYGNWSCMKVFTQGQSDRMNWVIQNVRKSLLNCKSCSDPCPAPVTAGFTSSANNIGIGTLVNFTNSSSNATGYRWYINNVLQSTATNYSFTFNTAGMFVVRLVALPGSTLCDSVAVTDTIRVSCPANANFTPLITAVNTNTPVNFINSSTGATSYTWYVNDVLQGATLNFTYAFTSPGNYVIKLKAANATCADSIGGTVVVTDTCIRQTFQKTYGGPGDDVAYDVRSTTDGGYVMAGKTNSFGSGGYDGYVVKIDNQGTVQWSRTYGGAAEDVIGKILQTPDGGYVLAGTTRSYGGTLDALVIKIDGAGTVQWARRFSENSANGEQAISICLTSDGGYGIMGSHNSAPFWSNVMVWKLDANGNVVWSKIFDSGNTDGGGYITQDGNVLMATAFTRTSVSYHDALVMKIDIANGNLLWMNRYEIDGRNNFAGEIYKVGNTYKFHTPTIQDFTFVNTGRHVILTLDNNGNTTAVQQLTPPDYGSGPIVVAPDGGIVAAYNEQTTPSDFNIMKLGTTGTMQWAKKYQRPGPQLNYILRYSQDGGYITIGASNPATNNDIYLAKVDIQGNSGGCDTTAINVTVQTPPHSFTTFSWNSTRNANFTNPINITVQAGQANTPVNTLCSGTTCVDPAPVDTCNGTSFQKIIGQGGDDEAYDMKQTPDGGLMVVGYTSATPAASPAKALVFKTDAKGNILWSNTYGPSMGSGVFYKIISTRDGNYVALGWGKLSANSADLLIVKIAPNGSVIWSKGYGAGTPFGERGNDIAEADDGSLVISLQYNTDPATVQPAFMRLDANGNMIWSRLFSVTTAGEALSVVVQGNVIVGSGVVARSGFSTFNDGFILKLRLSDGSLLWTRNIESQGRSNRLESMHLKNNELVFSMFNANSWTSTGITPLIFKTDTSGNVIYSRSYEVQGLNTSLVHTRITPTTDGGYIASPSELSNNTFPRLVKINANGSVNWARNYTPYYTQALYNIVEDSSGYVATGRVAKQSNGLNDILLIRTNTNGLMTTTSSNCTVTTSAATDNAIPIQSTPVAPFSYWAGISTGNIQSVAFNMTAAPVTLNIETPCIDTSICEPPPPPDSCTDITFTKLQKNADSTRITFDVDEMTDNAFVVSSLTHRAGLYTFGLSKLSQAGAVVWSKEYNYSEGTDHINASRVSTTRLADNTLLTVANIRDNTDANAGFILTRLTQTGTVVWTKKYKPAGGVLATDVVEAADGSLFVVGNQRRMSDDRMLVFKLDAAGNMTWAKNYRFATTTPRKVSMSMFANNGHLYIHGDGWTEQNGSFLCKLNAADGALVWLKHYATPGRNTFGRDMIRSGSNFYILNYTNTGAQEADIIKVDSNGVLLKSARWHTLNSPSLFLVPSRGDGGVIIGGNILTSTDIVGRNTFVHLDADLNFVRSYRYTLDMLGLPISGAVPVNNNGFLTWGNSQPQNGKYLNVITRYMDDGLLPGCDTAAWTPVLTTPSIDVRSYTFNITNENFQEVPSAITISNAPLNATDVGCNATASCTDFSISGSDTACDLSLIHEFTASKDSTCFYHVNWSIDTAFTQITYRSDTLIRVRFKQTGTVTLYGNVTTACGLLRDSLTITVLDGRDSVNLGPDRQLCKISVITLNAGAGFRTYRWQDGSMDSTYTAHQPGMYSVEVTDDCGNILRDTIAISLAPDIPFDLGPDLVICTKDTLTITAPAGFTKYTWAADYNISNRYTQSVRVWPSADTTYSVIAETTNGCLVFDTIRVKVNQQLPLNAGADTSFCQNDSATITATPGFTRYAWNTGDTTQKITVKNKGLYIVTGTAPNGCTSTDTLEILNVYALPVFDIGKDTILCENNVHTLDAGNFASYLWHDGSTGRTFTTGQLGKYWVRVTNANQCSSSDTVSITRIAELPQNFLDTAAEFCPYEKATLTANGNFVKYKWSTGSTASTIQVNAPAVYWLEVTNADGCTNREFINVKHKHCRNAIDFPNAFSPNNDRRNDTYKPIVKGLLTKYRLTVYNRWGQRIYETTDPTRAWDGTIGGKPQDSGGYVWLCEYQFAGEEAKAAKGTLLLIR